MRRSKYTAEVLAPIVASSRSLSDVIRKLGLTPNGGNHRYISARVRATGLDTSHFGRKLRIRVEQVSAKELAALVATSSSLANVLAALDLPTVGRAHHELKRRLKDLAIDTRHMRGQGWSLGKTRRTNASVAQSVARRATSPEQVFVENAPAVKSSRIAELLMEMGVPYRCAICGISEWCNRALVLHLDHVNGINNDNRLPNLRLLCPNCHSQTPTYCRRPPKPLKACEPRGSYTCYTSLQKRAWRNWYPRCV
jgi:hypothetical protein